MIKQDKIKNIFSFLAILFAEECGLAKKLMEYDPEYILEKWERYMESPHVEHPWGLHPVLREEFFDAYFERWGMTNDPR